ncbi:multiubiquitin domain-containing protein [Pseudonocardia sp. GCM10023141]|uniref:multiubiquitin domain-containing protein n=1 Tax=Pseudonocardia sp. GCM10023141 TaxID=3252653 RepID=UPI00360A5C8B
MSAQPEPHEASDNTARGHDRPRGITIVINARERTITDKELTFEQLVALAFPSAPTGENVLFTISFRRGHGNKPEGSLLAGETVKIKDGMVFVVSATDKS